MESGQSSAEHPIAVGSHEECERYRQTGKARMQAGDYGAAEQCYGMVLGTACSLEQYVIGFTNRAAARLAMQNFAGAVADADRAIALSQENPKAHFRKAQALSGLGQHEDALVEYMAAQLSAPGDRAIQKGIDLCEQHLSSSGNQPPDDARVSGHQLLGATAEKGGDASPPTPPPEGQLTAGLDENAGEIQRVRSEARDMVNARLSNDPPPRATTAGPGDEDEEEALDITGDAVIQSVSQATLGKSTQGKQASCTTNPVQQSDEEEALDINDAVIQSVRSQATLGKSTQGTQASCTANLVQQGDEDEEEALDITDDAVIQSVRPQATLGKSKQKKHANDTETPVQQRDERGGEGEKADVAVRAVSKHADCCAGVDRRDTLRGSEECVRKGEEEGEEEEEEEEEDPLAAEVALLEAQLAEKKRALLAAAGKKKEKKKAKIGDGQHAGPHPTPSPPADGPGGDPAGSDNPGTAAPPESTPRPSGPSGRSSPEVIDLDPTFDGVRTTYEYRIRLPLPDDDTWSSPAPTFAPPTENSAADQVQSPANTATDACKNAVRSDLRGASSPPPATAAAGPVQTSARAPAATAADATCEKSAAAAAAGPRGMLATVAAYAAPPQPGAAAGGGKGPKTGGGGASVTDYSRFQKLSDELSDDDEARVPQRRTARLTLDAADATEKAMAEKVFRHFDTDGDGFWSFSEAHEASKALEPAELTREAFLERCEEWGADPGAGWGLDDVCCIYVASDAAKHSLVSHCKLVNELERKAEGVILRHYSPGDPVLVYLDMLWKEGVVAGVSATGTVEIEELDPGEKKYDVILHDSTGLVGVPSDRLRARDVGYFGPTGLRGEGKKIAASAVLDPATGRLEDKDRREGAAKGGAAPSSRYQPAHFADFAGVGSELLDSLPPKSDLPEEPTKRLAITVERTGMQDEHTGFLSQEKVRKLLGQRQR
ncbi:hypothetical protein DIPPA_20116 [Diplonema papillatum]|nr:hypothetical protein DIPPA_20116 [Diplonema papillatum]